MNRQIRHTIDWNKLIQSILDAENISAEKMSRALGLGKATIRKTLLYCQTPKFDTGLALINWYVDVVDTSIPLLNGQKSEIF